MNNALTFTVGDTIKDFPEQTLYKIPESALTTVGAGDADLLLVVDLENLSQSIEGDRPDIHGELRLSVAFYDSFTSATSNPIETVVDNKVWPGSYSNEKQKLTFSINPTAKSFVIYQADGTDLNYGRNSDGINSSDLYYSLSVHVSGIFVDIGTEVNVLEQASTLSIAPQTGAEIVSEINDELGSMDWQESGGGGGGGTAPTRANVYPLVRDILIDGTNIITTDNNTDETVSIAASGTVSATDQVARDAAAAAQTTANSKITETESQAATRAIVENWAEANNGERIPAPKLTLAVDAGARTGAANAQRAAEEAQATANTKLTQTQVDGRISDWAETGNTDTIPAGKLPPATETSGLNQAQVDARVAAGVEDWAEEGDISLIPASKLTNAPSSGGTASATADILVEQIGADVDNLILPGTSFWVGTGIVIPESVHIILLDIGSATDDYHVIDWDTIRADTAGTIGALSVAGEYETITVEIVTNKLVRIGHDNANQLILAQATGTDFNLSHLRVERMLGPTAVGGGSGITAAQVARLLPEHTAAESDYIATSTDEADMWEKSTRRLGNPVLETPGDFVAVVKGTDGVHKYDSVGLPSTGIPKVARLPTRTDTSEELVILTHEYTEGVRSDATVTIAQDPNSSGTYGYADSTLIASFGNIDKRSPLAFIIGIGTAASYALQDIGSSNQDFIDTINMVRINNIEYAVGDLLSELGGWTKRITNYPEGLTGTTTTVNFKRADDTYYFTTGVTLTHSPGIYQKTATSYERLIYEGLTHVDGVGEPTTLPTAAAQSYVDDLGRLWVSGDKVIVTTQLPTVTTEHFVNPKYVGDSTDVHDFVSLFNAAGDGAFVLSINQDFNQFRNSGNEENAANTTWHDIWRYITQYVTNSAANRHLRDNTVWMGSFVSEDAAAAELSSILTGAFEINKYYYGLVGASDAVRRITSFTAGSITSVDVFYWRGPYVIAADVHQLILQHITPQDGSSAPAELPTRESQIAINEFGYLYAAASKSVRHAMAPSLTEASISTVVWAKWLGAFRHSPAISARTLGAFEYRSVLSGSFTQEQMLGSQTDTSWGGIRNWFLGHSSEAAGAPAQLFSHNSVNSRFIFGPNRAFGTDAEAALYIANNGLATIAATTPIVYFLGGLRDEENWVMRLANAGAYVAATGTSTYNELHWVGPFALSKGADPSSGGGGGGLSPILLYESTAGLTAPNTDVTLTTGAFSDYTWLLVQGSSDEKLSTMWIYVPSFVASTTIQHLVAPTAGGQTSRYVAIKYKSDSVFVITVAGSAHRFYRIWGIKSGAGVATPADAGGGSSPTKLWENTAGQGTNGTYSLIAGTAFSNHGMITMEGEYFNNRHYTVTIPQARFSTVASTITYVMGPSTGGPHVRWVSDTSFALSSAAADEALFSIYGF